MMRIWDGVIRQGWLPGRVIETRMLIDPRSARARFMDGAWLIRPDRVALTCTLGYRAPEGYDPAHRAALPDVSFAAAVWLYRLLIGGYPMEGAQTRRQLSEAARPAAGSLPGMMAAVDTAGEAGMADQLYGASALFAFDPTDRRNGIEGLGGPFADQIERWRRMPDALRACWIRTFSECLHRDIDGRVTPAQWADALTRASHG